MIEQIDAARHRYNDGIGAALAALADLSQLVDIDEGGEIERQLFAAIRTIDDAADAGINSIAMAADDPEARTVIHVGGDYIDVDIANSKDVAVGKDIRQTIED